MLTRSVEDCLSSNTKFKTLHRCSILSHKNLKALIYLIHVIALSIHNIHLQIQVASNKKILMAKKHHLYFEGTQNNQLYLRLLKGCYNDITKHILNTLHIYPSFQNITINLGCLLFFQAIFCSNWCNQSSDKLLTICNAYI